MAIIINLQFKTSTLNPSIQVGDNIYYTLPEDMQTNGGFSTTATPNFLGVVDKIVIDNQTNTTTIKVYESLTPSGGSPPFGGAEYYSFAKSGKANHNDLIGYYNEVKFVNNSKQPAKLFSVGTEATENSK